MRIDVLLSREDRREALRRDVLDGLGRSPKTLRSRWTWDARGSAIFASITELPEYYLTRRERELLERHAVEVARLSAPEVVLELGLGSSSKTQLLLDALRRRGLPRRFVAVDVSEEALRAGLAGVAARYPGLEVCGIVGDFERELPRVGVEGRCLVLLLGSTIGAVEPGERLELLRSVAVAAGDEGVLLLGVDLVKDVERTVAAYSDPRGLSALLIANALHVLNRELGAGFEPGRFASEACWNPGLERMEMTVRSLVDQVVPIPALGLEVAFPEGETLRTELSAKFRREPLTSELASVGLLLESWWTDGAGDYAVCLARQASPGEPTARASSIARSSESRASATRAASAGS
jgi:L-histidine N-alpha-methyltransferase